MTAVTREEVRSLAADLELPDDIVAALLHRYGRGWIDSVGAYKSLANAKGLDHLVVFRAAARGPKHLAMIIQGGQGVEG